MEIIKRNPKAFFFAVAMHLVLILFLVVGVDWLKDPEVGGPKVEVIQAKVVNEDQVLAEAKELKKQQEQEKIKKQVEKSKAERELAELKKQQEAEKIRLADLEKKRKEEAKKQEEEKKAEVEKKRQEELEEKRKKDEAAAEKRRVEQERKVREDQARKQREMELQQSLAAEQNAADSQRNAREIDAFGAAVQSRVTSNWLRPPGSGVGLSCDVQVRLSTNGTVLGVAVTRSSGNDAFDRSAETAVHKSDPLPPPPAGHTEITFTFAPDNQ